MATIYGTQTISEMGTICGKRIICGTETISGTVTMSEMETIICGMTGKNTFSPTVQGIGIATGTATATTGGMVTDAPSLMERG
jgi:1-deoxy-D-xylulose 5-phosphate reductoisomerase